MTATNLDLFGDPVPTPSPLAPGEKRWLPAFLFDEMSPPPRARPEDWLIAGIEQDFWITDTDDEDSATLRLRPGDTVQFYWFRGFGTASITIRHDGTWTSNVPLPSEANGFADVDDVETMADTPDAFARAWRRSTMADRPILFSGPMVLALLSGRKTQTRRVAKFVEAQENGLFHVHNAGGGLLNASAEDVVADGPTYAPISVGDRLWVREAHSLYGAHGQHRSDGKRWGPWGGLPTAISPDMAQIVYYRAGFDRCDPGKWRPSIHMPQWASRITLDGLSVKLVAARTPIDKRFLEAKEEGGPR